MYRYHDRISGGGRLCIAEILTICIPRHSPKAPTWIPREYKSICVAMSALVAWAIDMSQTCRVPSPFHSCLRRLKPYTVLLSVQTPEKRSFFFLDL